MLPEESAARNDEMAEVRRIPSMPRLSTPERSVKSAPSAARISVVAIAIESAKVKSQMFEFTTSPPGSARS